MTTADLIKILQKMPQEATVFTWDGEGHDGCVVKGATSTTVATEKTEKSKVVLEWSYERDCGIKFD